VIFYFGIIFSQSLKQIFYKDNYLSTLLCERKNDKNNIYQIWKGSGYKHLIEQAIEFMPLVCSQSYQPESLLQHFAEVTINQILSLSSQQLPQIVTKKLQDEFLTPMLLNEQGEKPLLKCSQLPLEFQQWLQWQQKLLTNEKQPAGAFQLGFQLIEAGQYDEHWSLKFILCSSKDVSFKLELGDLWSGAYDKLVKQQFGHQVAHHVLLNLAHAARIYPRIWQGMETPKPEELILNLEQASEFLQQFALILEDAGFKIIVPAQFTPKGRQRAKLRLRAQGKSKGTSNSAAAKSYLSLDNLTDYEYEFAIGDQKVSLEEWQQLLEIKSPLVHFRGQWMELDREKMQEMLSIWQQQKDQPEQLSVQDILKKIAQEGDELELDNSDELAQMLAKLNDNSHFELIDNPPTLKAQLRDYQKRGVSWLRYLDCLGLNGCLADDMGLGKTMQVIACLLLERQQEFEDKQSTPTLLIAPTSVLGNWEKEIEKFAPDLKSFIHHGSTREKDKGKFEQLCLQHDMVISSYTIVRKDNKLFNPIAWHRVVLDEAQNIKNPKAAQTKAILKLTAKHRLALTGTPVENRLMDLWSIFNFLNPNYLGKQAQFRKSYELPIQRNNNLIQSNILKQLTQPFILRRLKTDKNIIKDLPDKIDNKQYCNLSKEQASLYQVIVKDVEAQLGESEGIARQGLMLSTLMKLKQVCNHPVQFLQDESAFTPERSHKLERLTEMLAEAAEEGDSVLIFTQFTEIGEKLQHYLSTENNYPCYYLHGGVSRKKREQMISDFQDPDMPPAIFILSLKAGGVGITLTRANHVFHFDRWWNPAVENQATDRAFRIGQQKNVFVHKFVTLGTLEERIDQMIEDKQKMADNIIGNDESWLSKLDNQAFKSLIELNQNSIMEA